MRLHGLSGAQGGALERLLRRGSIAAVKGTCCGMCARYCWIEVWGGAPAKVGEVEAGVGEKP